MNDIPSCIYLQIFPLIYIETKKKKKKHEKQYMHAMYSHSREQSTLWYYFVCPPNLAARNEAQMGL